MLKIFMTGDNHIGLKYASHERARELCEARISAFNKMVRAANEEQCDLFVITGDLFEDHSVSERDVESVLSALDTFNGIVAILPGNHDYYDPDSKLWKYLKQRVSFYDKLLLLLEYKTYPLEIGENKVVLYPALCTSLHSAPSSNNLGWIKREPISTDDGAFHIGIAHGAVEGETIDREGQYFLMKRSELEEIPMDAWLIGHTHVPFPKNMRTDTYLTGERIFNAGVHVQTDVNCNSEGMCFILELDDDKCVRAKAFLSGDLHFFRKKIFVKAGEMREDLEREINSLPDFSVVEIAPVGAVTEEEYEGRREIFEGLLGRFLEHSVEEGMLTKRITRERIVSEFPETSLSARLLLSLLEEPKEAQLLYELLKTLKGERQ